jgi:flagellar basal-body rod protein FlgC
MNIDRVFSALSISSRGLSAQRRRMNVIADNLANAETTRTEEGGAYRRKLVVLKEKGERVFSSMVRQAGLALSTTHQAHMPAGSEPAGPAIESESALDVREEQDSSPLRRVHDPGHPDADADGYVTLPNVNIVTEMVNMVSASRAYEANVVAVNATKTMAKDALEI